MYEIPPSGEDAFFHNPSSSSCIWATLGSCCVKVEELTTWCFLLLNRHCREGTADSFSMKKAVEQITMNVVLLLTKKNVGMMI